MQAKVPPHSVESEQAVLGGLLLDNRAWPDVAPLLRADDFYREDHRLLFRAIAGLAEAGYPCDQVTVVEALRENDALDQVTAQYVGQLAAEIPSAANIRTYAEIVRDRAMRRGLIAGATKIVESAFATDGQPARDKLDHAQAVIGSVGEGRDSGQIVSSREATNRAVEHMERVLEADSEITGLPTGLIDLDSLTGGLQDGDLIYLAARPSMGKSALALQIAYHAASLGRHVGFFSLEMSLEQLIQRAQSMLSGVPLGLIRNPKALTDADWAKLTPATATISQASVDYVDMPGMGVTDLRAKARQIDRKADVGLIVVDYLQQIPGDGQNRNDEIERISRALKQLARELECPVLCLSQLNRDVERRNNKRPMLSDLRDSGSIEQDADLVLTIYRDEVYHEYSAHRGIAEISAIKQRNGPLGSIDARWDDTHVRFHNYAGLSRAEREREAAPVKSAKGLGY